MKKKNKVRMPAKGHDIPKKEEGGAILSAVEDAGKFEKPPVKFTKFIGKKDVSNIII